MKLTTDSQRIYTLLPRSTVTHIQVACRTQDMAFLIQMMICIRVGWIVARKQRLQWVKVWTLKGLLKL
jgi:hypothetical protein